MGEWVRKPGGAIKATDALLDYMADKRLIESWKLLYIEVLAEEMINASDLDRTAMIHEMLFVIRGQ